MMSLKTVGKAIVFVVLYLGVFWLLAQVTVYLALVGAVMATRWLMKR